MSLIPQRKHSPEELAALRAEEFPHAPAPVEHLEPEPPAAPQQPEIPRLAERQRHQPPEKHGTYHGFEGLRPEAAQQHSAAAEGQHAHIPQAHAAPVQHARKLIPEKSGTLHAFEGLRPDSASETQTGHTAPHAKLPRSKHDEREIMEMRRRDAFLTRPPIQALKNMALDPILAGILYLISAAVIYFTIHYWQAAAPKNYYAPAAGCSLLLLASLWIYRKKSRARHHAAFLFGIAIVILGFVILHTIKNPYAP